MALGWFEVSEGDDSEENNTAYGSHCQFFVKNDNYGADESTNTKKQVDHLNPIVLLVSYKQLKDAEVAEDVEHAAAGSRNEHRNTEIPKSKINWAYDKWDTADNDENDVDCMIFVSFGELLDERASEQIAQSSG